MSGGVITAAWVQAAPVWVAGAVGLIGLNTWRRQQRGQRQLEHAERAMATGRELFALIQVILDRFTQIAEEASRDGVRSARALMDARAERISRAWKSWRDFQGHYALAMFYTGTPTLDVAEEASQTISFIEALSGLLYEQEIDVTDKVGSTRRALSYRNQLFGPFKAGESNEIQTRLEVAEAALMMQLSPILSPPPWRTRALAALRARRQAVATPSSE